MKQPELWLIRDVDTGLFLHLAPNPTHGALPYLVREWGPREKAIDMNLPWARSTIEQRLQGMNVELVRGRCCGCCGKSRGVDLYHVKEDIYRCERHIGRSPCIVDGCARTFKSRGEDCEFICGSHSRLAPKRMRLVLNRAYREGEKRKSAKGHWRFSDINRYERIWRRFKSMVLAPTIPKGIEDMFGDDP